MIEFKNVEIGYGSYFRKDFLGDTLCTCCFYKEISFILYGSSIHVRDGFGEEMLQAGMITEALKEAHENRGGIDQRWKKRQLLC